MTTEAQELVELIAGYLDYPSIYIYMGGPSRHSRKRAERLLEALKDEGYVIEKKPAT